MVGLCVFSRQNIWTFFCACIRGDGWGGVRLKWRITCHSLEPHRWAVYDFWIMIQTDVDDEWLLWLRTENIRRVIHKFHHMNWMSICHVWNGWYIKSARWPLWELSRFALQIDVNTMFTSREAKLRLHLKVVQDTKWIGNNKELPDHLKLVAHCIWMWQRQQHSMHNTPFKAQHSKPSLENERYWHAANLKLYSLQAFIVSPPLVQSKPLSIGKIHYYCNPKP